MALLHEMSNTLRRCSICLLVLWLPHVFAVDFAIPSSFTGNVSNVLDKTPVGASIEFFAWPGYTQLPGTNGCLGQLTKLTGQTPHIRIGGTTQDRAQYDPSLQEPVKYSVASPADAPLNLTYGPSFIGLAAKWSGNATIGLNRELANLTNTIQAASFAMRNMSNLYAIELGNEPDLYATSSPIAGNQAWNPTRDAQSQVLWQTSINASVFGDTNRCRKLFQASVRLQPASGWTIPQLIPYELAANTAPHPPAISTVVSFGEHLYPQSACSGSTTNLSLLQSHSSVVSYLKPYASEIQASNSLGIPHIFSETNSATCGGGGISSTFGAALWIVDYVMQAVMLGSKRLLFHQGTIGNCAYCWWGTNYTFAPFYGAYFATQALADDSKYVQMLDNGATSLGVYAIFKDVNTVSKVLVYNSAYYESGTRPNQTVTLDFTPKAGTTASSTARALRLTAPAATTKIETQGQSGGALGQGPSVSGLQFANATCAAIGKETYEMMPVTKNAITGKSSVNVVIRASEAVLVYMP